MTPTAEGERLLSYARRILALTREACDVVARPESDGVVRLGITEDFAVYHLAKLLAEFARSSPALRLDVRCDLSMDLRRELERGELSPQITDARLEMTPGVSRIRGAPVPASVRYGLTTPGIPGI